MDLLIYLPADARTGAGFPSCRISTEITRATPIRPSRCRSAGCAPGRGLSITAPRTSRAAAKPAALPSTHHSRQGLWPRDFHTTADLFPDHADGAPDSVHMLFYPGQKQP